jgi:hypothetical protein
MFTLVSAFNRSATSGSRSSNGTAATTEATAATKATTARSGSTLTTTIGTGGSLLAGLGDFDVDLAAIDDLLVHVASGLDSLAFSAELDEAVAERARTPGDDVGREDCARRSELLCEFRFAGLEAKVADEHLVGDGRGSSLRSRRSR